MQGNAKIKVQGRLDERWEDWFEGMSISYDGDNTILSGFVQDESALHGILNRIRDLNLKLISVNPANEDYDNNNLNNHKNNQNEKA